MNRISKIFTGIFLSLAVCFGAAFAFFPLPGNIPVLMYHFIGSKDEVAGSKNFITHESFVRQMKFLHLFHYHIITIEEYYEIKKGKRKPRGREILLTFDDGNISFEKEQFPILKRYHFPSTEFLISESIKRQINGSMSEKTIKELLATGLVTIEGHTQTHPALSTLEDDQIRKELGESKKDLEQIFGVPIDYLAYPLGDVDARVARIAQETGYRLAFTTSYRKLKDLDEGPYTLTRSKISSSSDHLIVFWVKISGIYPFYKNIVHELKQLLHLYNTPPK